LKGPTDASGIGPKFGRDTLRKLARELAHVLEHARAPPIDVRAFIENYIDIRKAIIRAAANGAHMRGGQHRRDDRICDLVFDQIRTSPRPLRVDDDLGIRQIGNRIKRNAA
jgi:hypothetical protein